MVDAAVTIGKPHLKREALTIARILRVNHAGEYGAIRIYTAQIRVAARLCPEVVPALSNMLAHGRAHCAAFFDAMPMQAPDAAAS